MRRCLLLLVIWLCAFAPAYAQLQPGDVPSNEDLARSINPDILGDVGELTPVPFDPANPGAFGGCDGNAECEDIINDLGSSTDPDMTDIDAVVEEGIPSDDYIEGIAETTQAGVNSCDPGSDEVTQTTTDTFEYRCNSGTNIQETENRCDLVLIHTVAPGYVYECPVETAADGSLIVSDECELLDGNPSCVLDGSTCTDDNGTQIETVSCRTGPESVETNPVCARERVHEISLQYIYECQFVLNEESGEFEPDAQCQSHIDDGNCTQGGQQCSEDIPPDTENISCVIGNELVYSSEACEASLQTVLDEQYYWRAKRDWVASPEPGLWVKSDEWLAAEAAACKFDQEACLVPEPVIMETLSCQIGNRIEESTEQCLVPRLVITDDDYFYEANRNWNAGQSDFVGTASWTKLNTLSSCVLQGSVCSTETLPVYEVYRCEEGYRVDTEGVSCNKERLITVDTDYQYKGHSNWDEVSETFIQTDVAVAAEDAQCLKGAGVCVVDSPGVFSEEVCERGYQIDYTLETVTRDLLVVTDDDYIYEAKETWDGDAFIANAARTTLVSQPTNCVEQSRTCTQIGSGVFSEYFCDAGYRDTYASSGCDVPRVVSVDRDYLYQADRVFQYGPDVWNSTSQLAALKNSSVCTFQNEQCITPSPGVFDTLTCEIGTRTDYTLESGSRQRIAVVDEDYIYDRYRTWNGSTHAGNASWTNVNNDSTCTLQDSVCSTTTPQPYTEYSCNSGYQDTLTSPSCQRERIVTVDRDYQYTVNRIFNTTSNSWTGLGDWNAVRASSAQCALQSESCAQASPGVTTEHSCQVGYSLEPEAMTCDLTLGFTVETDYRYIGYENWNGSSYVKDATLTKINQQKTTKSCVRESVANEQGLTAAQRTSTYECIKGTIAYAPVLTESTCSVPRVVTTGNVRWYEYDLYSDDDDVNNLDSDCYVDREGPDTGNDYVLEYWHCPSDQYDNLGYTGSTVWKTGVTSDTLNTANCSAEISSGATMIGETCTQGPQTRTIGGFAVTRNCWNYSRTYQSGGTGQSCEAVLNVSVVNNSAYVYEAAEYRPNGQSWYPNNAMRYNSACSYQSVRYDHYNWGSYRRPKFHCTSPQSVSGAAYKGRAGAATITENWDASACTAAASQGSLIGSVCLEGPETRNINGESVHKACWKERRSYSGPDPEITFDSCSPPAGFVYKRQTNYTGSPALGTSRSLKKREYEKVEPMANVPNRVSDYVCFTGYWKPETGANKNYSCSPPAGASQKSSVCAWRDTGGTCRLYAKSYTVPNPGPTGGYNRHKETWKCDLKVTGSGVAAPSNVTSFKDWVYWESNDCSAKIAEYNDGCVHDSSGYAGPNTTKTIDGHSITRQFRYKRNYTCQTRTTVDTCQAYASNDTNKPNVQFASFKTEAVQPEIIKYASLNDVSMRPKFETLDDISSSIKPDFGRSGIGATSPPVIQYANVGDYTYEGQTCLNYEAGVCTLWERNYEREEVDPSGGCLDEREVWRCENSVSGAGTATILRHVDTETFSLATCNAMVGSHTSCTFVRQTEDLSTGGTRVIDGLSVNRPFWGYKREYNCSDRVTTETCSPPSGAVIHDVECLWEDASNVCRLVKRNYRIPQADPTGGCTTFTDTFRCENRNHGSNNTGVAHDIISEKFPTPSDYPSRRGCVRKSYTWGPTETRVVNGLSMSRKWQINENFECSTETPVDTCSPLPTDAVQSGGSSCISANRDGSCGVESVTYRYPVADPSGGCLRVREEYACTDEVSGAGAPVAIPRSVDAETWNTAACASQIANDNCELLEDTCIEGPETRTIDGLPVYQACWKSRRVYECSTRETINTCSPPSGATFDSETCLWTDRSGVCRLKKKRYLSEEHDPSGGCSEYTSDFRCEETVASLTPKETISHYVSNSWDYGAYADMRAANDYDRCVFQGPSRCLEGAETRIINGVSVARSCWSRDFDYECEAKTTSDSCESWGSSTIETQECLWTDRGGECRLYGYTLKVPEIDPSGGCHSIENVYTCDDSLTWGGADSEIRGNDLLGASDWPPAANLTGVPRIGYLQGGSNDHVWSQTEGPYGGTVTTILAGQGDTGNGGGGGRTLYHTIDGTQSYEVSLYFKVTELGQHRIYAGLWARDQVMSYNGVANRNPYFTYVIPTAAAGFEANTWYKLVGVILPEGSAPEARGTYGGIYHAGDGHKVMDISHFIWNVDRPRDDILVRFFNHYGTDNQALYTHFYAPSLRPVSGIGLSRELETLDVTRDAGLLADESVNQSYSAFNELKSIETNVIDSSVCQQTLADRGNCQEVSSVCEEPSETRTIDGLDVTQACWSYRFEYNCSTTQIINTCETPANAIANGTNCLWSDSNGVCRLNEKIYNIPLPDPTNGCSVWTDSYRCEEQQTGVGPVVETVSHVQSITWDNTACEALDFTDRACSVTESCSAGQETRLVNGVSVTQSCWERTRNYSCNKEVPVDTCDVPSEAVQTSSSCALTNDAGICILFDRNYEWRVRDGSGGCHQYDSRVLCNDRSTITRAPEDYGYILGATTLDLTACNAIPANDNTCREKTRVCSDSHPTTRRPTNVVDLTGAAFVPGKPSAVPEVNRECWEYDITYECEQATAVDTCANEELQTCRLLSETCSQEDRDGGCVKVDRVYDCDIEGTGGCVSQTTSFSCVVDTPPVTQDASYRPAKKPANPASLFKGQVQQASYPAVTKLAQLEVPSYDPFELSFGEHQARIILAKANPIQYAQASGETETEYEPVEIIATIERSYWDNTACSIRDNNSACELISTTCTEEGTGSAQAVRRAQDDFHQQYVDLAGTVVEPCWNEQKVYSCGASSALTDCSDEADRCVAQEESCLLTGDDGECLLAETSYECGAAQCEPSRRICDFRHDKAAFKGHKYTCSNQYRRVSGTNVSSNNGCVGLSAACSRTIVSRDVERYFVDNIIDNTEFGRDTELDVELFVIEQFAYYCPTAITNVGPLVNAHGYVEEGSDAEAVDCAPIEASPSCTLLSDNCVVGSVVVSELDEGEVSSSCTGGRRKVFDCTQSDPDAVCSGGCTAWEDTYTCESEVDGVTPTEVTDPEILSRIDTSACDALNENDMCALDTEVCVEGEETRLMDGVPVHASCWKWERTYLCAENNGFESDCEVPNGCDLAGEECLGAAADGTCLTTEHIYSCTETNEVVVSEENPGTCEDEGATDPYADPNEDDEPEGTGLFDVIAGLNSVGEGSQDYQSEPSLFEGDALKCGKLIFGAKNCCKKSGLLIGLGCSQNEEKLAVARDKDRCISIGSYCSKKAFFGTCLKKKETYCCFNSELARIVVETGVQQIGKDLGSPKNPKCDGFSVTQFQLLDLGQADFSSVADSMLEDMNMDDPSEVAARLTERIKELQGGGG